MIDRKNTEQRTCFYLSHLLDSQLSSVERYRNIKPSIAIIITKYNWIQDSKNDHNTYKFYDKENNSSFGDTMTIHTVELTKLKDSDAKQTCTTGLNFLTLNQRRSLKWRVQQVKQLQKRSKK